MSKNIKLKPQQALHLHNIRLGCKSSKMKIHLFVVQLIGQIERVGRRKLDVHFSFRLSLAIPIFIPCLHNISQAQSPYDGHPGDVHPYGFGYWYKINTRLAPLMKKSHSPFWVSIRRVGSLHSNHVCPAIACSDSLL